MQTASHVSRRALLSGAAASLALPLLPRAARAQSTGPNWGELNNLITGGVQQPNDPRFVWLTQPENLRYYNPPATPDGRPDPDAPLGVVRPQSREEVVKAINWCRKYNVPMVPRSGGHSYAGCSTVKGLVINSAAMRSVKIVDVGNDKQIEVGGGALFGDLLESLRDMPAVGGGRYTITHGRCRGVGLSAFLMGGGWAIDSCYLGMGCDRVKKVELVLADGSLVQAEETGPYSDLFWAVRGGGGGNLAYATKWWLEAEEVHNVVVFNANWRLSFDLASKVFPKLFRKLDAAPTTLGAQMTMSTPSAAYNTKWAFTITLRCIFHGTGGDFESLLRSTINEVDEIVKNQCAPSNPCASTDTLELRYWDAQEFFEERGYPNRYQEISLFAGGISDALFQKIFEIWYGRPKELPTALLTVYRVGGKVNEKKPGDMAFVHRTSKWMITSDIGWSSAGDPNLNDYLAWQRGGYEAFFEILKGESGIPPGSYQNFPDPGLGDYHAEAYWGSNLTRLKEIKKKYDPNNVFNPPRNQGIA